MEKIWREKNEIFSRLVFKMWHFIIGLCVWKIWNNSSNNCRLCPSHYLNAPGLSLDVMLKMTKIELELIPVPDMYIFFEKGTSGLSYISKRYGKATSKCFKSYDPNQ